MPERIQRSRLKGWRMPEGAVAVSRPSRWGNPWKVEQINGVGWCCTDPRTNVTTPAPDVRAAHALAVARFRSWIAESMPGTAEAARQELRGKVLVCWCPLTLPCHADVLLELANAEASADG